MKLNIFDSIGIEKSKQLTKIDRNTILSIIVGVGATIVIGILAIQELSLIMRVELSIITSTIMTIVFFVYRFHSTPLLLLEPLNVIQGVKPVSTSQFIGMRWTKVGEYSHELHADFGVIRITAKNSDALGCRAKIRYGMEVSISDAKTGKSCKEYMWTNGGYLNWFSDSFRHNLTQVGNFDYQKLNIYLKNTVEEVYQGENKDLLLCYTIPHYELGNQRITIPIVYLCSDMDSIPIGMINNNQSLEFQVEITLSAQNYSNIIRSFDVKASLDKIIITPRTS